MIPTAKHINIQQISGIQHLKRSFIKVFPVSVFLVKAHLFAFLLKVMLQIKKYQIRLYVSKISNRTPAIRNKTFLK